MKFEMWSIGHYFFMASPFILAFFLYLFTRNKSRDLQYKTGIILSVICVAVLLARNIEIFVNIGYKLDAELIPLQICHFANFVLLFAFLKKSNSLFALSFCLNLPAAMLSIVFANSLSNYATIFTFRAGAYLVGHMLIVGIALWTVLIHLFDITKKTLMNTLMIMFGLYIGSVFVNNLLKLAGLTPNYFYTIEPEAGTPLESFYEWGKTYHIGFFEINPIYILMTGALGVIVVMVFYGLFMLINGPKKQTRISELKESY